MFLGCERSLNLFTTFFPGVATHRIKAINVRIWEPVLYILKNTQSLLPVGEQRFFHRQDTLNLQNRHPALPELLRNSAVPNQPESGPRNIQIEHLERSSPPWS